MANKVDYRSLYDRDYLGHFDLPEGREVTVTIASVKGGELIAQGGRKSKKPIIMFEGKEKGLIVNKTNGKAISGMYGPIISDWPGKRVTLYKAQTQMGADLVDCIRIRPQIPQKKTGAEETKLSEGPPPETPETLGDDADHDKDNH